MTISEQLAPLVKARGAALRDTAETKMLAELKETAPDGPPRDGGPKLRDSFTSSPFERGDIVGTVIENNVPHAEWVSDGTPPHVIRPVRAKALHFVMFGEDVFAKEVHHPGTSPNPYFENTTKQWGDMLQDAVNET